MQLYGSDTQFVWHEIDVEMKPIWSIENEKLFHEISASISARNSITAITNLSDTNFHLESKFHFWKRVID